MGSSRKKRTARAMALNTSDIHFLGWIGHYCSDNGVNVGKISRVIIRNERRGFLTRNGLHVALTDAGQDALRIARPGCLEDVGDDSPDELIKKVCDYCKAKIGEPCVTLGALWLPSWRGFHLKRKAS